MNFTDPFSNTIACMNVALAGKKKYVYILNILLNWQFVELLYNEGAIKTFHYCGRNLKIKVYFNFTFNIPLIKKFESFSKPGWPCYISLKTFNKIFFKKNFHGFYILNTEYGLLTSNHICLLTYVS